jgi:2-polyprenyl-3-methyl-5-hydroxy-6-metoxy-1,4-benzoquinol methylase
MNLLQHEDLKTFWELHATPMARHHISGLDDWAEFIDERLLCHLQDTGNRDALEWGCGSGDISQRIADRGYKVHVADILESSLDRTELNLLMQGHDLASKTCIRDIHDPALPLKSVDVLVSVAVVQHFPSYEYWRQVASIWRSLSPETIILQTRHNDVLREPKDYSSDYLFSLWMPTEAVVSEFPEHELVFHHVDRADSYLWSGHANYEFFVFRKPAMQN